MRGRRGIEEFSVSFLDVICCGFGAIILLLMITKTLAPVVLEISDVDLDAQIKERQDAIFEIRGQIEELRRQITDSEADLDSRLETLADLNKQLTEVLGEKATLAERDEDISTQTQALASTKQSLTDEQARLLSAGFKAQDTGLVGGIAVDSEYLIFVIDTSGSMQSRAWTAVNRKVQETLQIYPQIKGIQVMNDMGDYMFSRSAGTWIEDTPAERRSILNTLSSWAPFSNSSPVEGIEAAISTYYSEDKNISIYVFGDDYTGNSVEEVVRTVDRLNSVNESGQKRVRINAVGFPVHLDQPNVRVYRFAALMRELAFKNDGTFVGLISNRG